MLNNIMLVGRLSNDLEIVKEGEKEKVKLTLAVNRAFKNEEGIYETDFIDCVLWNTLASNVVEYCKKGDVVGVRGRLESKINEETNLKEIVVVVDKLTFLSSKKVEDEEE